MIATKKEHMDLAQVRELIKLCYSRKGDKAELAREAGVSRSYISHVIAGRVKPSKKLLDALNLKVVIYYTTKH